MNPAIAEATSCWDPNRLSSSRVVSAAVGNRPVWTVISA